MAHSTGIYESGLFPLAKRWNPSLRSRKKDGGSPSLLLHICDVVSPPNFVGIRDLQYTSNESRAVRIVGSDIQVFDPSNWSKGVIDKLKVEVLSTASLSPGKNPSIALFVGERKVRPFVRKE